MNSHDSVSVIIPTYNRSALLSRAIKLVLAAISPGDEVLVIDDGSTDDTPEVVRSFGNSIRYFRIENSGPGAARNLGIRLAKGPLVAFLDSDDEWVPDKLELHRRVMEAFPEVVFSFSNLFCRHPNGKVVHDILSVWRADPRVGCADSPAHLGEILSKGVPFSTIGHLPEGRADFNVYVGDMYPAEMQVHYVTSSAAMVRKELAGDSFYYSEDVRLMEDWECFARLAKAGPVAYLDSELAVQIVHEGTRLTDAGAMEQTTARIRVLQRIWGKDEWFLRTHSAHYQRLLTFQYLRRAILLIGEGQLSEAKQDLLHASGGPLAYRVLTKLPSGLVRNVLGVRRTVMGLLR